jgi:hypothetical protein
MVMEIAKLEALGESADKIMTSDLRLRMVAHKLYEAARKLTGGPLSLEAAKRIKDSVKPKDIALITTGFIIPPYAQETDGPSGAAALARTLDIGFNVRPVIITEEESIKIVEAACKAFGLNVMDLERAIKVEHSVAIVDFPLDLKTAENKATTLLNKLNPSVLIAIEKAGRNKAGVYHRSKGWCISEFCAKIEPLFEKARERKILTIGIGDGGNEVGMGSIEDVVRRYVPYGDKCQCPCGAGIAAESKVDLLIAAAVSNWGAYALATCLSVLSQRLQAMHDYETEVRAIEAMVNAGAIDGGTGLCEPSVDTIPAKINGYIVEMLRYLALRAL